MFKIKILLALLLFSSISFAQEKLHKNEPSKEVKISKKGIVKINKMYFENTEILATYFKSGVIINGFPGYNHAVSKLENSTVIKKWLAIKGNQDLLTKEGYQSILTYINKK